MRLLIVQQDVIIPLVAGTIVMGLLIGFILLFIVRYQQKQRSFQKERAEFSRELLQTKIEIQEQTLSNISRELHDNLGQTASLIKLQLNLLNTDEFDQNQEKIDQLKELSTDLMDEIRSISLGLKSENLERFGLIDMIQKDVQRYQKIGLLNIKVEVFENQIHLDTEKEIFLYRISQEIFNNILKHASAKEVSLTIKQNDSELEMIFKDDGIGFDPNLNKQGNGLENIKERCDLIHAKLKITSNLNVGTTVEINLKTNEHGAKN